MSIVVVIMIVVMITERKCEKDYRWRTTGALCNRKMPLTVGSYQ